MTYCETDQNEPVLTILTDAAITGNVINPQSSKCRDCLKLKMKAIWSSETSGSTYPATQCNIPGIPESSAPKAATPPSEPHV